MSGGLSFSNITGGNLFQNLSTLRQTQENQEENAPKNPVERLNMHAPGKKGEDKVTISEEGKNISLTAADKSEASDPGKSATETIKKRIEALKQEIEEIKNGDLPEEEKQKLIQQKTAELVQLVNELAKNDRRPPGWLAGTECQGFGGSIS
ncbi:hypothetical protein [Dethiosulfatarculus sandiegensis]|uniref:Uncharacterized protein n=1 Tax=Dethiosulfatarculus sandiegensis TaxID=1429043 RepID=A0A0D2GIW7_9BACT|nr:hypothetical protein [Dethiosulfatarculus sandiegensis]KIX14752.1 hypothetical protein X474_06315 [Dethiosulfatarculus sandiegensis]